MFSDGYSNAAIGPVNTVLNAKFPEVMDPKHQGANPRASSNRNLLSAMAFAGMVSRPPLRWRICRRGAASPD